jgi:hypothetical protein
LACHAARHAARCRLLRLAQARRRKLCLRRAFGCLGTSRGSSRGSSRRSSSTTPPRVGSSSTTPPTPHVRVPRHVAWLISPLVIDYSTSRRLVIDYFAYAARLGALACRVAHLAARRQLLRLAQALCRLLRLRRTSGCLGTSRGSSRGMSHDSSSTTPPRADLSSTTLPTSRDRVPRHVVLLVVPLVVDYFAYVVRPGASARRAARHTAHRRLLCAPRLFFAATLALLQPRRASRLPVSRQHWLYFEYVTRCRDVVFWSHRIDHSSRLVFQNSRERQSHPQQLVGINFD